MSVISSGPFGLPSEALGAVVPAIAPKFPCCKGQKDLDSHVCWLVLILANAAA